MPSRGRIAALWRRLEAGVSTRRGAAVVFLAAVAVHVLESVALPVIPGRDFGTYLRFYVQAGDWHSVWPMTMLYRTPLAPLVVGLPLDVAGGWGAQVVMALAFALSVTAWSRAAGAFGRRPALLTAIALLLYPGYGILFHELASDSVLAAAFALFAWLLARAWVRPTPARFALVGLAVAATALARPANQILAVVALAPLLLALAWRVRLAACLACAGATALVLGLWTLNNGLRYDDYAVSRGGEAFLPFFRAFTYDHIVEPGNGRASRELADAVRERLLTQEPYRSYGVDLDTFFARGSDREFADVVGLSDRVWGWDSDYATMRRAGVEAVRAHPGTYVKGVAHTLFTELWHPLYVALPQQSSAAGASPATVVVGGRTLPDPGSEPIPASHQSFASTTRDGHIREVWTSPTAHRVVFSDPSEQRRYDAVNAEVDRLAALVPPYGGSERLTRLLSRSSKLFPPPVAWLLIGLVALVVRRPARTGLALILAGAALLITAFNAMSIYTVIEFAIPLMPALVLAGIAGLTGARPPRPDPHRPVP